MSRGLGPAQRLVLDKLHEEGWLGIYQIRKLLARARFAAKGEKLPELFGAFDTGRVSEDIGHLRRIYALMRSLERRRLALRVRIRPSAWMAVHGRADGQLEILRPEQVMRLLPSHIVLARKIPVSLDGVGFDIPLEAK